MRFLKALYSLILKCLTVKGVLFFTSLALCFSSKLEGFYVFIAGSLWVGSRELYKHLIQSKLGGVPLSISDNPKDEGK